MARAVADALSCRHVDTGAMYRAVGWLAVERGVPLDADDKVAALAEAARFDLGRDQVVIDGHDVTRAIRTPDMDQAAARVARLPGVRRVLLARQRAYAHGGTVVMEGRDIGTVVLPHADVKVFLDASADERARRRAADTSHASGGSDVGTVAQALHSRDELDRTRTSSPLARADDAIYLDTTALPVTTVVATVLELVRRRRAAL